jgi:diguanylate cyclase (GGDEF)-like protein/PAS domain S-box-containing protein
LESTPLLYSIVHDITERKRAEAALLESEERFELSMEATNDGLWDWNIKTGEGYFSPGYYRMLGYEVGAFSIDGDVWRNLIHPEDLERALQVNTNCIDGLCEQFEVEYRMKAGNGEWRWIMGRGKCIVRDEQKRGIRLLGTIMDITERKQAEEVQSRLMNKLQTHQIELQMQNDELLQTRLELDAERAKYFDLYDLAPTGYMTLNAAGIILEANLSAANLLGVLKFELGKQPLTRFIYKEDQDIHYLHRKRLFDTRAPQVCELRIVGKAGALHWVRMEAKVAQNSDGTPVYWETLSDITERKLAEEQLGYKSTHDALTGIYNRAFFEVELARLEHSREFPISIVMADVDQLKVMNDTQGHAAGDEMIRQAANALRAVFREADVLARIGGDEFAVLLPSTDSANAEQMLARVQEWLGKHNAETLDFPVQLSLGTATAEKKNLTEAFTLADQRIYTDKATRKAKANRSDASS